MIDPVREAELRLDCAKLALEVCRLSGGRLDKLIDESAAIANFVFDKPSDRARS